MLSYREFFRQNEMGKIIDFSQLPTNKVTIEDVSKFERRNPEFSVNILSYEGKNSKFVIFPLRL